MGKYSKYLLDIAGGKKKCTMCIHEFNPQKDSNTRLYSYHLKTKHPNEWRKLTGIVSEELGEPSPKKTDVRQKTIEEVFAESGPDSSKNKQIERAIVQLITTASLPISIVDHVGFKNFCQLAVPRFQLKSRHHYQRKVLVDLFCEYKKKLSEELDSAKYVSISYDGWSDSSNKHQYLGIIVNFIQKSALTFRLLGVIDITEERHTGSFLSKKIREIIEEYQIETKICASIRDRGSNVKSAAEMLAYPHFDCMAHKLNLAVGEGTESFNSLQNVLDKLRKLCNLINKSGNNRREFDEINKSLNLPPLSLKKHVKVRWNTVHAVFERGLRVRDSIDYICSEHENWPKLTETDWNTVQTIVTILQPIVDATVLIQNRGMLCSAIIPLCKVLLKELDGMTSFRSFCDAISRKLNEELKKYEEIEYLQIATLLDCRFKDNFCDGTYWKETLLKIMKEEISGEHDEVTEAIEPPTSSDNPFSRFLKSKTSEVKGKNVKCPSIEEEHSKWFRQPSNMDENPIEFWQRASTTESFPTLSRFYQKYLSSPATTAEAERLFSSAKTVLTDNRKLLSAESFSKLMFLQQNVKLMGFQPQQTHSVHISE